MDIKLSNTGVNFNGRDLVMTATYLDNVAQRIAIMLETHVGEWFLDLDYGVDWLGKVFGKNRSKTSVDALLRLAIRQEKYVEAIIEFNSKLDNARNYSATFRVKAYGIDETTTLRLLLTNNGLSITTEGGLALLV